MCTTAQRDYALEAWRILDPHCALIPSASTAHRIFNVMYPQSKSIETVLGLQSLEMPDAEPVPAGSKLRQIRHRAPFAVILDDKPEVRPLCEWLINHTDDWSDAYTHIHARCLAGHPCSKRLTSHMLGVLGMQCPGPLHVNWQYVFKMSTQHTAWTSGSLMTWRLL